MKLELAEKIIITLFILSPSFPSDAKTYIKLAEPYRSIFVYIPKILPTTVIVINDPSAKLIIEDINHV